MLWVPVVNHQSSRDRFQQRYGLDPYCFYRQALYALSINPESQNPYEYLYDGEYRAMQKRTVKVSVPDDETGTSEQSHTTYFTHFGPVVESKHCPGTVRWRLPCAML